MMECLGIGLGIGLVIIMFASFFYSDHKRVKEGVQIEMIRARIMLLSTDPFEIQKFLENKEPYITKDMIEQLINRIAEIKAEESINMDWASKLRIVSAEKEVETTEEFKQLERV